MARFNRLLYSPPPSKTVPYRAMVNRFSRFDAAELLNTPEQIAAYLEACFEEDAGDGALIRSAFNDIARAKGMTQMALNVGLSRDSLHKALGSSGNLEFTTIIKVMKGLGLKLHATAV